MVFKVQSAAVYPVPHIVLVMRPYSPGSSRRNCRKISSASLRSTIQRAYDKMDRDLERKDLYTILSFYTSRSSYAGEVEGAET
jgi:hypothetical protein